MDESTKDRREDVPSLTLFSSRGEREPSIDLMALLRALLRGKMTVAAFCLIVFCAATAVAFLLPPLYTSSVSFITPNPSSRASMSTVVAGELSLLGGSDLLGSVRNTGDLYAGILRSRSIANAIVQRFDLKRIYRVQRESDAESRLAASTAIVTDAKSTIITLSVTDKRPEMARDIANAYMDALRDTEGRLALSQSAQRRLFFGQQLAKEKDELEDAEVEFKKTEERSGFVAPSGQTESEIRTIAETQAQIAAREVELAALRQSATEQNPEVIRLQSEIADLQGQLSRLRKGSGKESNSQIATSQVPQLQLEFVRKEREVKYHEALFETLSRQYEAARLDEARDAPLVQVLDPASYPDKKSSPKRLLIMLGGMVVGIITGCVWVLARAYLGILWVDPKPKN